MNVFEEDVKPPEIIAFDNSMLSNYKRCPKYFYYRNIEHLSAFDTNFNMDFQAQFGVAVHKAMDEWFLTGNSELMDSAFLKVWLPFEGTDPKELRTTASGLIALAQYRKLYPLEREPFYAPISPEYIEVGFACELGDFIYCGRIDKIVRWKSGFDGLVILDHKTSASKGYLNLKPNAALDGYIWGVSQLLNENIIGAYLDQIYLYKKGPQFIRELTRRCPEEISWWKQETLNWILEIEYANDTGNWNRNTGSCSMFGKSCEYKILCSSINRDEISSLKEAMYEVKPWIPYPDGGIHGK